MKERIRLRPGAIEWREIEGEVVALELPSSTYLGANRTAAPLWSALAAGTTREKLVELLIERYDVDRRTATADIAEFLEVLTKRDLLEADSESS